MGRGFKQWTGDDSKALMKVWPSPVIHVLMLNFIKYAGLFTGN